MLRLNFGKTDTPSLEFFLTDSACSHYDLTRIVESILREGQNIKWPSDQSWVVKHFANSPSKVSISNSDSFHMPPPASHIFRAISIPDSRDFVRANPSQRNASLSQ